jgi:uncharacterized membrane protein YcaP (DUF421 family)
MFDMSLPWWEFILRAVIIYCVLMVMMRVSGRRTVGQFTPFDLLIVMLLSEAVSNSLHGGDEGITGGLIVAATLVTLNLIISTITANSRKAADIIEGTPVLLGRNGQLYKEVIRKCKLSEQEVEEILRQNDAELHETETIFLEPDGEITVQKKKS